MEYIRITDGKMLLTLSAEDMAEYRGGRPNAISAIRRIVSDAHERYGGEELDGRLFVQMYESKGGGCELFVTRLRERRDIVAVHSQQNERMMAEYRGYIYREARAVYSFTELEKMLLCCKLIDGSGYRGLSESYADRENGKYYLVLDGESPYPAETMGESCPHTMLGHIREHCRRLFGDHCAPILGRLAQ